MAAENSHQSAWHTPTGGGDDWDGRVAQEEGCLGGPGDQGDQITPREHLEDLEPVISQKLMAALKAIHTHEVSGDQSETVRLLLMPVGLVSSKPIPLFLIQQLPLSILHSLSFPRQSFLIPSCHTSPLPRYFALLSHMAACLSPIEPFFLY